ncbi:MAG: hypothetical protein PWP23_3173 [Candidatus Sumerlaeota bacterium]|nr:hypothetical protein [Candidatus Sumerlaeota bacterium]
MLFAFPTGMDRGLKRRPLLSVVVVALILYRALLSGIFPLINVRILPFFPVRAWNTDLFSALVQSAFTPAFPGGVAGEHRVLLLLGVPVVLAFWLIFGPALEDLLGRKGFAALFVGGLLAGLAVVAFRIFGVTEAFWLGHAATLVAIGFCYAAFAFSDVRLHYLYWIPLLAGGQGRWEVPAIFFLVPIHLFLALTQLDLWYLDGKYTVLWRAGAVNALGWHVLLPILGGLAGLAFVQAKKTLGKSGKEPPAAAWGA